MPINFQKQKFFSVIGFIAYATFLYLAARFLLAGLDGHASKTSACILTLAWIFLCASKRSFAIVLLLSCMAAVYCPVGYEYGPPDFQAISSLLATDAKESLEFLSFISAKSLLKALAIPLLLLLAYGIAQRTQLKPWRNKALVLASILCLVVLLAPIQFFSLLQTSYQQVEKEKAKLESFAKDSAWTEVAYHGGAKDYVLVIGESVRRDYMGLYGYPVNNTPFLSEAPATVVKGLSAGGTYTIGSLRLMLTKADKTTWQPRYDLNIVDLANAAGLQTYWISNQGYLGKYDTPISAIGSKAQTTHFVNASGYETARHSDRILLDIMSNFLNGGGEIGMTPRLFVLHTLGSHPSACERIKEMQDPYVVSEKKWSYVGCYISSIKYTDELLRDLYDLMRNYEKKHHRPFSILYFADHGMVHRDIDGVIYLNNNKASKRHYDIPLAVIDSASTEHRMLHSAKSGLHFTDGLAGWMGISARELEPYDLFDGRNDANDFDLKEKIRAIKGPDDPAVDISAYLQETSVN